MTGDGLPYRPCVGIVLLNREGRIFVGQRIDTPGAWQMPQGGIDQGEQPQDAALRELGEEIGIRDAFVLARTAQWLRYELPEHLRGNIWGGRYGGQQQMWFLMRFCGRDDTIDLNAHPPAEFSNWRWSTPDEVLRHIVPFKARVYAQVLEEFSHAIALAAAEHDAG